MSDAGGSVTVVPAAPSPASQADPLRAQLDEVRARLFAALAGAGQDREEDPADGGR